MEMPTENRVSHPGNPYPLTYLKAVYILSEGSPLTRGRGCPDP